MSMSEIGISAPKTKNNLIHSSTVSSEDEFILTNVWDTDNFYIILVTVEQHFVDGFVDPCDILRQYNQSQG